MNYLRNRSGISAFPYRLLIFGLFLISGLIWITPGNSCCVFAQEGSEDIIDEIVEETVYSSSVMVDNSTPYDLRAAQSAGLKEDYNVLEGGCTDNEGYAYYAMMHNNKKEPAMYKQYCQIIKVRLSDMFVEKVSQPMKIYHGNDLAYNPGTGYIYAVHVLKKDDEDRLKVSVIDRNLQLLTDSSGVPVRKKVTYDPSLAENVSQEQFNSIVDFSGITYHESEGKGYYALLVDGSCDLLIVDEEFRAIRYISENPAAKRRYADYITQGIDSGSDYIVVIKNKLLNQDESPRKNDNILLCYDWTGSFIKKISIAGVAHEAENILHATYIDKNGQPAEAIFLSCYAYNKLRRAIRFSYIYMITRENMMKYVENISFPQTSLSLVKGSTANCKAVISPSDATSKTIVYESRNPNIVTISKTGIVKGVSFGTSTVTASNLDGNHTASCKITVRPASPTPLTPKNTSTGVKFSWTKVPAAKGYLVYRRPYSSSSYTLMKTITNNSQRLYQDKKVKSGKRYVYAVASYVQTGTKKITSSRLPGKSVFYVGTPQKFRIKGLPKGRLKMAWKPVTGVKGYQIEYSLNPKFKKKKIIIVPKQGKKQAATPSLTKKKVYYIRMRAYSMDKGKKQYSAWTKTVKKRALP